MSSMDARQPPRFVPTLTDVIAEQPMAENNTVKSPLETLSVPVLPLADAMVNEPSLVEAVQSAALEAPETTKLSHEPDWSDVAQDVQAKVMERLDEGLEERLRYALADIVQLHTQTLYQAIRDDVQNLVSAAVHEAVAQEIAQLKKSRS